MTTTTYTAAELVEYAEARMAEGDQQWADRIMYMPKWATEAIEYMLLAPTKQARRRELRRLAAFHGPRLQQRLNLATREYIAQRWQADNPVEHYFHGTPHQIVMTPRDRKRLSKLREVLA